MTHTMIDFFGRTHVVSSGGRNGTATDRVRHLLETDEGTRNSYAELVGRYWFQFDGLDEVLPAEYHDAFLRWLALEATSWKSIQNRALEIQRARDDLAPSPDVEKYRRVQGGVR